MPPSGEHAHLAGRGGYTCNATKLFSFVSMIIGVVSLIVTSTQISHTPSEWVQMSEYLSYNQHDANAILGTVITDCRFCIGAGALATLLCTISLLAARKPVAARSQYFVDVFAYSCSAAITVSLGIKLLVDSSAFSEKCQTALAQVDDKSNPSMRSSGHTAFCYGVVRRISDLSLVFISLGAMTSLACASNWCGILCRCCCKVKER